jgi:hypothetical protein
VSLIPEKRNHFRRITETPSLEDLIEKNQCPSQRNYELQLLRTLVKELAKQEADSCLESTHLEQLKAVGR